MAVASFTIISHWDKVLEKVTEGAKVGLADSAEKMKSEVIGELYRPKSGHIYGGHQASAPTESPASDTKKLEDSIEISSESDLVIEIAPSVPYAMELEFGTVKMAPRPMWTVVGTRLGGDAGQIIKIIVAAIQGKLR